MSSESSSSYTESSSSDENIEQYENLTLQGDTINNYNVICELGRGAFSIVWLCYNIVNNNFYALKIQNPKEYKEGLDEIRFVKNLPNNYNFNYLIDHFIEVVNNKKYLCSVWELCAGNLDDLVRKNNYKNKVSNKLSSDGLPFDMVKSIMRQILPCVKVLHKMKYFHGDIKTDNILIKGKNDRDQYLIDCYTKENFFDKYTKEKAKHNNLSKNDKLKIRKKVHSEIVNNILKNIPQISKYNIDTKYLDNIKVCLSDFGMVCHENDFYEFPFGTRYYQSPEIILMGTDKCVNSFPVDIWALACTLYELLSGKILFDPIKDSRYDRNYYHLRLINKTCGTFEPGFLKKTKYYKKYFDNKYCLINCDEPSGYSRLETKLKEFDESKLSNVGQSNTGQSNGGDVKVCECLNEIFKKCLEIDPRKRANIDFLSNHFLFKP
jgi:serine/threonine protein kinase